VSEAFVLIQMVMSRKRGGKGWRERGGRQGMAWRWVDELLHVGYLLSCTLAFSCMAFLCWKTRSYGGILIFWLLLLGGYLGGGRWKLY